MYILFPLTRYDKSVYSTLCSGEALPHRVLHLREHGDIMTTPLLYYYENGMWYYVTPSDITETLSLAVRLLGPTISFLPKDLFTRSICAAGAMAVLNARVDGETICIIGRWCFNTMLCYSHVQDAPIMNIFSSFMVSHRKYTLQYLHDFPCFYPPPPPPVHLYLASLPGFFWPVVLLGPWSRHINSPTGGSGLGFVVVSFFGTKGNNRTTPKLLAFNTLAVNIEYTK